MASPSLTTTRPCLYSRQCQVTDWLDYGVRCDLASTRKCLSISKILPTNLTGELVGEWMALGAA